MIHCEIQIKVASFFNLSGMTMAINELDLIVYEQKSELLEKSSNVKCLRKTHIICRINYQNTFLFSKGLQTPTQQRIIPKTG